MVDIARANDTLFTGRARPPSSLALPLRASALAGPRALSPPSLLALSDRASVARVVGIVPDVDVAASPRASASSTSTTLETLAHAHSRMSSRNRRARRRYRRARREIAGLQIHEISPRDDQVGGRPSASRDAPCGRSFSVKRCRRSRRRTAGAPHTPARACEAVRMRAKRRKETRDDSGESDAPSCVVHDARNDSNEETVGGDWVELIEHGDGAGLLAWLVAPADVECVRSASMVTCVRRGGAERTTERRKWFSMADVEATLASRDARYGIDADVTSYVDGVRRTHNSNDDTHDVCDEASNEIVDAKAVMRAYRERGRSIRLLHPQTRHDATWKMLATLESHFECACGCNVYVTPANAQGFAPHYDDIDAYVLQIEGEKRWRVYAPFQSDELPRTSSKNYTQEEIAGLEVLFDGVLEAGDFLYIPRGFVHQAECSSRAHSVHATISTNQANTHADAFEIATQTIARSLIDESKWLRRNIYRPHQGPRRCLDMQQMGQAVLALGSRDLGPYLFHAYESLRARFQAQRLPVPETHLERSRTSCTGDRAAESFRGGELTKIALQRRRCLVLVDGAAYHPFSNSRDGSHERIFSVSGDERGRVLVDDDVIDILEECLYVLQELDGEATDAAALASTHVAKLGNGHTGIVDRLMHAFAELIRVGALAAC